MGNKLKTLQDLDDNIINGYFETADDFERAKEMYLQLKFELMQSGETVDDNINFDMLPKFVDDSSDNIKKVFGE